MITRRPKLLVLSFTEFAREPRALKQARYLSATCSVTTSGFGSVSLPDSSHVELPDLARQRWGLLGRLMYLGLLVLRIHRLISWLSSLDRVVARKLGGQDWDIVIAHDLWALPAALRLAPKHGVVLDLHEYAPSENEYSLKWRLVMRPYVRWLLRKLATRASAVVTVGDGIARKYKEEFGLDSVVVVNATPFYDLEPRPVSYPIRLVHSGVAAPERRLKIMIDAVRATTADVILDFYLVKGPEGELEALKGAAGEDPRIRFIEAVPYSELVTTLNSYDVGLSIFPPTTFNLRWCLPNKFFDFVQARLGVIIGPSPEMARIVNEGKFGLVIPDFDHATLAAELEALTAETVTNWKASSAQQAMILSSERQMETWGKLVRKLMASEPSTGH